MGFLHNVTLELKEETSKAEIMEFLDQAPDDAHITTVVTVTPKDRPYESEKVAVALQARWTTGGDRTAAKRVAPPISAPIKRGP